MVKGYAAHEKGVFEEVTRARAGIVAAAAGDDVPAKAAADAAMQQALVKVNAVAENYPELKANVNFLELQSQLAETENQIAFARIVQDLRGGAVQTTNVVGVFVTVGTDAVG